MVLWRWAGWVWLGTGPAIGVVPTEASSEDIEESFEVVEGVGSGQACVGTAPEGCVDLAYFVASGSASGDDDGGRGFFEASEEFEHACTGFTVGSALAGNAQWEPQIDDGYVDGIGVYEFGCFVAGACGQRLDTHGREETGEVVGP